MKTKQEQLLLPSTSAVLSIGWWQRAFYLSLFLSMTPTLIATVKSRMYRHTHKLLVSSVIFRAGVWNCSLLGFWHLTPCHSHLLPTIWSLHWQFWGVATKTSLYLQLWRFDLQDVWLNGFQFTGLEIWSAGCMTELLHNLQLVTVDLVWFHLLQVLTDSLSLRTS
jgi:hypothetical protein